VTILRVIDIETTGLAPPAEIIEIGRVDVVNEGSGWSVQRPFSRLYKPLHGISPETKAVHHITEDDIPIDAEACTLTNMRAAVMNPVRPNALVAHNCAFERTFITDAATEGLPWICTYKCALRLWPEAPGHSNQILRYWRGLILDVSLAMPPHRAAPDAWVTAHLLEQMLSITSFEQLIAWTAQPKYLPTMPFGKHRNEKWEALPIDYLDWLIRQRDLDDDILWNARQEIERRKAT
jgi:exodeoxyribonuclease X